MDDEDEIMLTPEESFDDIPDEVKDFVFGEDFTAAANTILPNIEKEEEK
jgi:hypothetical protein